ncbi:hypothetical protein TNCV_931801, partial [Trichonephila clavipes]
MNHPRNLFDVFSGVWYWDRTRDQASHDPIPIPLGYRGLKQAGSHFFDSSPTSLRLSTGHGILAGISRVQTCVLSEDASCRGTDAFETCQGSKNSLWRGAEVWRGGANSDVILVTSLWFKITMSLWHGDTLKNRRVARPLVRLVEGEER